ncbi:MAG: aldehyde-activating protein, partial [Verrucomicrobia bacterium]
MPTKFTGGCTCGAIRYECTAEPIVMFNCHCRDCQRGSGGPYTGVVYVPA